MRAKKVVLAMLAFLAMSEVSALSAGGSVRAIEALSAISAVLAKSAEVRGEIYVGYVSSVGRGLVEAMTVLALSVLSAT